jgi:prepilin-type N-terminal cleavage/methylation domain-containing protein/prepilin-type processing-associated H-X9-DG protein
MHKQQGFTLVELLVVISIIALLMAILAPSLQQARKQAKAVVCMSNLHQWSLAWSMYAQENDGSYFGYDMFWGPLRPYYKDREMHFCPMATRTPDDTGWYLGDPFSSWEYGNSYGSYGMNGYFHNPAIGILGGHGALKDHWKGPYVKGAANVPLFLDSNWVDGWPEPTDEPPEFDGQFDWGFSNNMRRYCVNRHNGVVNGLFADFSVRKIGLKQLWKLKWHRNYDISYPAPVWPDWMKTFKDYD